MKNIKILFAVLFIMLLACGSAFAKQSYKLNEVKLEHGFVQVYDFGNMKLHAYQSSDAMLDEAFVLESATTLIAIETPRLMRISASGKAILTALKNP